MAKSDLLLKAQELGLDVTEDMTAKEIQSAIDSLAAPVDTFGKKLKYEEWNCQIKKEGPVKLTKVRSCVKITEDQAAILNEGVLKGSNSYGLMYFLPE
jgi:hypothetical protein